MWSGSIQSYSLAIEQKNVSQCAERFLLLFCRVIVVIPLYDVSIHISRLMEGKKYGGPNVSKDQTGQKDKLINSLISLLFILPLV